MVIRRKDGNVYVLEGPNPIVENQVRWDIDSLIFHNFSWDEINFRQEAPTRTKPKAQPKEKTFVTEEPALRQDDAPSNPRHHAEEPEKEESSEGPKEFDLPYIKYKVLCYCLPATTKIHVDKLYGESWQKTTYGGKFIFPCVMMESSDIELHFWTSDPNRKIGEKSIIYPFSYEVHNVATDSYDKVPYDEYRWWKVSSKESKEGGWLFRCVPSENHPDFSG